MTWPGRGCHLPYAQGKGGPARGGTGVWVAGVGHTSPPAALRALCVGRSLHPPKNCRQGGLVSFPFHSGRNHGSSLELTPRLEPRLSPTPAGLSIQEFPSPPHLAGTGSLGLTGVVALGVRFEASSRFVLFPDPAGAPVPLRAAVGSPHGSGRRGSRESKEGRSSHVCGGPFWLLWENEHGDRG